MHELKMIRQSFVSTWYLWKYLSVNTKYETWQHNVNAYFFVNQMSSKQKIRKTGYNYLYFLKLTSIAKAGYKRKMDKKKSRNTSLFLRKSSQKKQKYEYFPQNLVDISKEHV